MKTIILFCAFFTLLAASLHAQTPTPTPTPISSEQRIDRQQLDSLPVRDRSVLQLLQVLPGFAGDFDFTAFNNFAAGGRRRTSLNFEHDGVQLVNSGSNLNILYTPSLESLQEVTVLPQTAADRGRSSGASVLFTTRRGGDQYRFSLFEYVRNDAFNANNFFSNRSGLERPKLRSHNFGGTAGGPVPFLENTRFFFSSDHRRHAGPERVRISTVPTAAERSGDLSGRLGALLYRTPGGSVTTTAGGNTPLMVAATNGGFIHVRQNQVFAADGRAYAGNMIPAADIDPRSAALLARIPLPNGEGGRYTFSLPNTQHGAQETLRIDHSFNNRNSISGRFTQDHFNDRREDFVGAGSMIPGMAPQKQNASGHSLMLNYSAALTNSFSNRFELLAGTQTFSYKFDGFGRKDNFPGFTELFPANPGNIIPTITVPGLPMIGAEQSADHKYRSFGFRDHATYAVGDHTLKFGAEVVWENSKNLQPFLDDTAGSYRFDRQQTAAFSQTGDALGSFLLGRAFSYTEQELPQISHFRHGRKTSFLQDEWRLRDNLTLLLGLRYQYFAPPVEKNGLSGSFDPALYDRAAVVCATPACSTFSTATDPNNGIRMAEPGNSVIRADKNNVSPRVGLAFAPDSRTVIRAGYGLYYDQPVMYLAERAMLAVPSFNRAVSYTSTPGSVITFDRPDGGAPPSTLAARNLFAVDPDLKTPEFHLYSAGLERELFPGASLQLEYFGSRGTNLIRPRDINFVTPVEVAAAPGRHLNSLRPFLGYGTITNYESTAKSRHNALYSVFKYNSGGLHLTAAYTYSNFKTDASTEVDQTDEPQNPYDMAGEYAESRLNRPHAFAATYIYRFPRRNFSNKAARALLNGFEVAGITELASGFPVPRATANTQGGRIGLYPNLVGDPSPRGQVHPSTGLPYIFNPAAFTPAAEGEFGNAPRSFARLPYRFNTNLAISKRIGINERVNLQLRAEAFNAFNRQQFTAADTLVDNMSFGLPTATAAPRELQFGVRLNF